MPRVFTLGDLVTRARQRAEQENSDFVTDPELKGMLSTGYGELYSMLVESGLRYFESEQTITANGSASYALPTDHLSTIGVDREVDGATGRRYALEQAMVQERNLWRGHPNDIARTYALVGSAIVLAPNPSSGTYYHIYVPQPTDLTTAADATDVDVVTPDGEAFLEAYVQVEILAKEESDVAGAVAKRERARERVSWWATQRFLTENRRPAVSNFDPAGDEYGDSAYWWYRW